jgi:hypothetical protein
MLEMGTKGQYCDEETSADAAQQESREDRDLEINSNGVYLVGHICGACGGKMMIGGTKKKIECWCSRCKRLANNVDELQEWWDNVKKRM